MKNSCKKIVSLFLILVLVLSFMGCGNKKPTPTTQEPNISTDQLSIQDSFDNYLMDIFKEEVTSDTISLNYSIKDPKTYDIEPLNPTYGNFSIDNFQKDMADLKHDLEGLQSFPREQLNEQQKELYDLLEYVLNRSISGEGYEYYTSILSPTLGLQSQLPTILAEFHFRTEQDVIDYLQLIETTPDYFNQLIRFEQAQSEKGFFMADSIADKTIKQCQTFIKSPGDNVLIKSFNNNIEGLDSISASSKKTYKAKNKKIVQNNVIPAYQSLIKALEKFKGTGTNTAGLASYPNGKEYYEYLFKVRTGSTMTVSEAINSVENRMVNILLECQQIYSKDPVIETKASVGNFDKTDPKEILAYLEKSIVENYPENPDVNYEIKTVDESLAEYTSPAFYMVPAIDDYTNNCIYINTLSKNLNTDDLFDTLAHEGYPGHLYQTTYAHAKQSHPLYHVLSEIGASEGWATYVEFNSFFLVDYGSDTKDIATFKHHNLEFIYALQSRVDFGVNYEGWDLAKTEAYLTEMGLDGSALGKELFEGVIEDPCNIQSYYIGALEIQNMRTRAEKELGNKFNLKEFHRAVLDAGSVPMQFIDKSVTDYIAKNR